MGEHKVKIPVSDIIIYIFKGVYMEYYIGQMYFKIIFINNLLVV